MYTRCPNCSTIFRVTAVQLRVALGEVNCGSCQTNFNALNALSDDLPELTDVIELEPVASPSPGTRPAEDAPTDTETTGGHTEDITDIHPIDMQIQADEPRHGADEPEDANQRDEWAALLRDADEDAFDTNHGEASPPAPTADNDDEEFTAEIDSEEDRRESPDDEGPVPNEDSGNGLDPDLPSDDESDFQTPENAGAFNTARHTDDAVIDEENPEPAAGVGNEFESDTPSGDEPEPEAPIYASKADGHADDATVDEEEPAPVEDIGNELESGTPAHDKPETKAERRYDDTTAYEDEDDDEYDDTSSAADPDNIDADEEPAENSDKPPPDELEFNAPEQTWSEIFLPAESKPRPSDDFDVSHAEVSAADMVEEEQQRPMINPLTPLESQTADPDEWRSFLSEVADEDSAVTAEDNAPPPPVIAPGFDDEVPTDSDQTESSDIPEIEDVAQSVDGIFAEADLAPPWTAEQDDDGTRPGPPGWRRLVAAILLLAALGIQLVHQNRDHLAAHSVYGEHIRNIYAALGATLYPDWSLDTFKVSGSEAVAGRTTSTALDILANVIVDGTEPVGQPMIRIVLRDRWANPIASRVFAPSEYLHNYETWPALLPPGTMLPVEISVADPGTEAQGYVVDVCLPRRTFGLQCQIQSNPFQK